ncbi:MAG: TetR/AcrR family transcriptional regulator [Leptospirales bacterium]
MSNHSDPRIVRTRRLLLDALFDLLKTKDIKKINVQEIAKKATLNRATLYDHYKDKYDLFEHLLVDLFHQKITQRLSPFDKVCSEKFRHIVVASFEFLQEMNLGCTEREPKFKSLIESKTQEQLFKLIYQMMKNNCSKKPDSEIEIEAAVVSWSIFGVGLHWVRNHNSKSPDEYVQKVLALVAHINEDYFVPEENKIAEFA